VQHWISLFRIGRQPAYISKSIEFAAYRYARHVSRYSERLEHATIADVVAGPLPEVVNDLLGDPDAWARR
jgi:hypothetical protein